MGKLGRLLDISSASVRMFGDDSQPNQRWVRKRIEYKRIPHVRIGGRVFIPEDELEAYLKGLPGVTAEEALKAVREAGDA